MTDLNHRPRHPSATSGANTDRAAVAKWNAAASAEWTGGANTFSAKMTALTDSGPGGADTPPGQADNPRRLPAMTLSMGPVS